MLKITSHRSYRLLRNSVTEEFRIEITIKDLITGESRFEYADNEAGGTIFSNKKTVLNKLKNLQLTDARNNLENWVEEPYGESSEDE